jgi:hypothetical protein
MLTTDNTIQYHGGLQTRNFVPVLSLFFLLISNSTNRLRLHQVLGTKTTEANKSLKTDANGAY